MVLARFNFKNENIKKVTVSGHAEADNYGNDLVCAGITAIISGTLNGLDQLYKKDVELIVLENEIVIIVKKDSKDLQKILIFLLIQLQTIEIQYPKNFKIEEVL
ncbi:ribosomal-processing cysteine protease Prp [Spiroplasma tabanidicola]|uniref:Ribosomal processing cysteine protease Prp n=1 Tax=Spiroplasma tabanidicola TaxID=324079 RepID=A0A6I6C8C4_9MOLU|nr:ribosomal-processing cysteine protease Prp [Spiroplasma tabanidicola]QGS51689.1 ribosomal-processing cysteine protease Prp [Spiroplasma tabanidicola]